MGLGDLMSGSTWNESQDIVDPMGLMHTPKADREAAAAEKEYGDKALGLQEDWMDYIKDKYAPYSEVATKALDAQMGMTGLSGGDERQRMLTEIEADPFYQAKVAAGDDAVLRGASATGGLRSGDANEALAGMNQELLSREIESKYQKLAGLSGQGFMGQGEESQYGSAALGEITGTLGTMTSGANARAAAASDRKTGAMGAVGGILSAFSDARLKANIREIGMRSGLPWYKWDWNDTAGRKFGLRGEAVGFMADDVEQKYPELVIMRDGYKTVVYGGVS